MKPTARQDAAQQLDLVKSQFLRECITASAVKDSPVDNNMSYTIDWDAFAAYVEAPETLICRSRKAWSKFTKMSPTIQVLRSIGARLTLKSW